VLIGVDKPLQDPAACASAEFKQGFALSTTTERGRAILSLLTSAMVAGKSVSFRGTGTCSVVSSWSGSGGRAENLAAVTVIGN
jgi:hypothetical protein